MQEGMSCELSKTEIEEPRKRETIEQPKPFSAQHTENIQKRNKAAHFTDTRINKNVNRKEYMQLYMQHC